MDVLGYLDKDSIVLGVKSKSKKDVISFLLDHLIQKNRLPKESKKEILKTIIQREKLGSTAIGSHIAFPHARVKPVKNIIICLGVSKEGVDFNSLDQEPVNIVVLLLSNQKEAGLHLKMLAFLAKMLRDKYLVQRLKSAKSEKEVLALLDKQRHAVA